MKILVVGRHTPDLGAQSENFEVVSQENVMFPTDLEGTLEALRNLRQLAAEKGAEAILLQNTPVILAAALIKLALNGEVSGPRIGAIVSVPGPREANLIAEFALFSNWVARRAAEAINFVNNRAKTEVQGATLKVTVDPVSKFVFSHVEWLL